MHKHSQNPSKLEPDLEPDLGPDLGHSQMNWSTEPHDRILAPDSGSRPAQNHCKSQPEPNLGDHMTAKTDSKVYLTPQGKRKLEEELEYSRTTGRDEISSFMADIMEEGDISENSGYDDARAKMGALESRIFELEGLLARAIVIEEGVVEAITLGATVKISDKIAGRDEFTIVGTHEAEPLKGRISDESPVGKSLLGKKIGDKLTANGKSFKVVEIRFG
jgi:transcription elongation factor GreA